jgi:hypothetical protein
MAETHHPEIPSHAAMVSRAMQRHPEWQRHDGDNAMTPP